MADLLKGLISLSRIEKWLEKPAYLAAGVSGLSLLIVMVVMCADLIGRKLLKPVPGSLQLSEGLMVVIVFMAVAYTTVRRGHVFVDIATRNLPPRVQEIMDIIAAAVMLALFGAVSWLTWGVAWHSFEIGEYREGLIPVATWPFRMLLSIGLWLFSFQLLLSIVRGMRKVIKPQEGK